MLANIVMARNRDVFNGLHALVARLFGPAGFPKRRPSMAVAVPTWAIGADIDWNQWRAPVRPCDKVLLSETHLWIRSVPSRTLPKHLCHNHPHLANRLARCWGDVALFHQFMDDVLIDRRGNRKGVSNRVRVELERLAQIHAGRFQSGGRV